MQPTLSADLHTPYSLPSTTAADFQRDGFVKLPRVLEPTVLEALEPDITDKVRQFNTTSDVPVEERSTLQKA